MNKKLLSALLAILSAIAASSCKKETVPTPDNSAVSVLSFSHNIRDCYMPVLLRYDGTLLDCRISWGDGSALENYVEGSCHTYTSKGPFTVEVYGKEAESVNFEELYGISSINLSNFK